MVLQVKKIILTLCLGMVLIACSAGMDVQYRSSPDEPVQIEATENGLVVTDTDISLVVQSRKDMNVKIIEDKERGNVCYLAAQSISCVKR